MQLVFFVVPLLLCGLSSIEARRKRLGKRLFGKARSELPTKKLPGISMPSLDLSRIRPPKMDKVPIIGRLKKPNLQRPKPPSMRLPFFLRPKERTRSPVAGPPRSPPPPPTNLTAPRPAGGASQSLPRMQPAMNPAAPPSMTNPSQPPALGQPTIHPQVVPQIINNAGYVANRRGPSQGRKTPSLEDMEHSLKDKIQELDETLKTAFYSRHLDCKIY